MYAKLLDKRGQQRAIRKLEMNRNRTALDHFGVEYQFQLYEDNHGNRIAERIRTHVLPFFARHLDMGTE